MRMIRLLFDRSALPAMLMLIGMQLLAGMGGAGLLAVLTDAAGQAGKSSLWRYLWWALSALALFVFAQGLSARLTTVRVERSIHMLRLRIMAKLVSANLQSFERIGESKLLTRLEKDMKTISGAIVAIIAAGQSAMLFVCSLAYLAYLSPQACAVCAVILVLALLLHFARMGSITRGAERARQAETGMFGLIGHMIGGFKELKLNDRRRREISAELAAASSRSAELNRSSYIRISDHLMLIQIILYVLIGAVVFILPALGILQPLLLVKTVAVILFLTSALNHAVGILPVYAQAEAAARHIGELECQLGDAPGAADDAALPEPARMFSIDLQGIGFAYAPVDGQSFEVGPIDLSIRQGEIIFVTGGNGSGKSTFLKLLTGLQAPNRGVIRWNGGLVEPAGLAIYRSLFAAVFWDYHLFPALYGLDTPEPAAIDAQLQQLSLHAKTRMDGRSFSSINLSTGQRKRLAHLVALLEDRQIYIFDEWAADQDPLFRRWFYHAELPRLKAIGKTVIAVTHDEQYFDCADRWLHFEEGRYLERKPDSRLPMVDKHERK